MYKKLLFYCTLLLKYKMGFCQSTYIGKFINKSTSTPIEDVKIYTRFGSEIAQSDEMGLFNLPLNIDKMSVLKARCFDHEIDFNVINFSVGQINIVELDIKVVKIGEVNIKQSRLKEKLKESALTVESMSAQSIKETPASDFYEALGHLKGVDITAASLGFRIVNTRGFNSTSPVRTLQVIDGVDNQSPGLNFSLGNFLGASELDIASQEIVVGASSAFYGPGAFNGVISLTTKDVWKTPGFSYKFKVGERQLMENSLRYAKVFKNKSNREFIALKLNFYHMKAYDWEATNKDVVQDSKVDATNPGGYDAVNRYGDEVLRPGEYDQSSLGGMFDLPGLGRYFRDGYWESDIVDYNTYNLKTSAQIAVKPFKDKTLEFIFQTNYGQGSTVYQGDNRYSLKNIQFYQNRLEFKHKNGFVRVYTTYEDAGNTYDAVFTALLLQEAAKPADLWGGDYQNNWRTKYANKVKALSGYPTIFPFQDPVGFADSVNRVIQNNLGLITKWHEECRALSNKWTNHQNRPHQVNTYNRYEPGTSRFDSLKNVITQRKSFGEGGSGFFDRSSLYNYQIEHRFPIKKNHLFSVGTSGRLYTPNSAGTIFADTNGRVIRNHEVGAYLGWKSKFMHNKLKMNATFRADKNINFPFVYSPALSFVYTPKKTTFYRLSLNSGVRNPTLADQYLYYNVGRAILLGNINGYKNLVTMGSLNNYFLVAQPSLSLLSYFNVDPVVPEKVKSIELGYKAFLYKNKLNIDASAYFSYYQDFIGYQIGFDPLINPQFQRVIGGQVYRVATNAKTDVTTVGTSIGVNYFFAKNYTFGFNYSFNQLNKIEKDDPIIPAFNTPPNKFNVSIGGSQISIPKLKLNDLSFNVNFKWIQGFLFEGSPQFTGNINSYYLVDAMIAKEIPKYHIQLKMGASNLTNNMVMQVYGGPQIGRMAYASILFDLVSN